jgi:hypothetical protein
MLITPKAQLQVNFPLKQLMLIVEELLNKSRQNKHAKMEQEKKPPGNRSFDGGN